MDDPVIIDLGSYRTKVTQLSNEYPVVIDTVVDSNSSGPNFVRVGKLSKGNRPVEAGRVLNWNDIEELYEYIFSDGLHVDPQTHPVLLGLSPFTGRKACEIHTQIMFEAFNVPALDIRNQGLLALMATGRTTGVAVDIGMSSSCCAFWEGDCLSCVMGQVGGKEVTTYMGSLLKKSGYNYDLFDTTIEM